MLIHADDKVRREPHKAMDGNCHQGILQVRGVGIHVWRVFAWTKIGPLMRMMSERSLTTMCYHLLGGSISLETPFLNRSMLRVSLFLHSIRIDGGNIHEL